MVNFDVNLFELSDVYVLVEFEIKLIVSVFVMENICFVVLLLEMDVKKLIDFQENVNIKKNMIWVFCVFEFWCVYRNSYGEFVKELYDMNIEEMNYYFGCFIVEVRKQDG